MQKKFGPFTEYIYILIETAVEETQILVLLDKDFKWTVFKMLTELKETKKTII